VGNVVREKKAYDNRLVGKLEGILNLKDKKVDGSTVLKLISNEWYRKA
jgi:hypothetical protein